MKNFLITIIFSIALLSFFACEKSNNNSGNPIQNDKTVSDAIATSGFTTYDGNAPPNIDGTYSTSPMQYISATGNLNWVIGQYMNSKFKLSDYDSEGNISFTEWTSNGLWGAGTGGYISGSGNNFTIWIDNSVTNGASTVFLLSGTYDETTGNLINCNSLTVYVSETSSYVVGDYYTASGYIRGGNSIYGKWTKTFVNYNLTGNPSFTHHIEFFENNTWAETSYMNGAFQFSISGTWSVSGQAITMNHPPCAENNYNDVTRTGTYSIGDDGSQLALSDLYVWTGMWTRE